MDSLAVFIVATLYPEQLNTLKHMRVMLQGLENYYHPSNFGSWTPALTSFIHTLSSELLKRTLYERQDNCKIPLNLRLDAATLCECVSLLSHVAFLSMFSKDAGSVNNAHFTLRNLAWILPDLILPQLLDHAYPALDNLVETHRTLSCIQALGVCVHPLVDRLHYPDGAKHVADLLLLVLPVFYF